MVITSETGEAKEKCARFCPECGFKMTAKGAGAACSAEVSPGTMFCLGCGANL